MSRLGSVPVKVAMLETPAGFQPNVDLVYRKIGEFMEKSLQNFRPEIDYIGAYRRGTPNDPDDHEIAKGLLVAQYIFTGPGSPTYTARMLRGTLSAHYLADAYKAGATVMLASAAAIAAGKHVMRVYEIFKAGAELGWDPGLGLLEEMGLGINPVIVTHWNNTEGGVGLDTSHCYVGTDRFEQLIEMLPAPTPVLGVDEHTACILEPGSDRFEVKGAGTATIINGGDTLVVPAGESFPLDLLRSEAAATAR